MHFLNYLKLGQIFSVLTYTFIYKKQMNKIKDLLYFK
jgi:hypothetical protein